MNETSNLDWLIPVAFGAALFSIAAVVAGIVNRIATRKLRAVAEAAGGRCVSGLHRRYAAFERNGREIHLFLYSGTRYIPARMTLKSVVEAPARILVMPDRTRSEALGYWLMGRWRFDDLLRSFAILFMKPVSGLESIVESGYRVYSDNPMVAEGYLNDDRRLDAVLELLDEGFEPLDLGRNRVIAIRDDYRDDDLDPERLGRFMSKMSELA